MWSRCDLEKRKAGSWAARIVTKQACDQIKSGKFTRIWHNCDIRLILRYKVVKRIIQLGQQIYNISHDDAISSLYNLSSNIHLLIHFLSLARNVVLDKYAVWNKAFDNSSIWWNFSQFHKRDFRCIIQLSRYTLSLTELFRIINQGKHNLDKPAIAQDLS